MIGIGITELLIILILVFLIAVPIILIILALRWIAGGGLRNVAEGPDAAMDGRTARQVLDERYARGEIGRDEYHQMRRDIRD